MRSALTAIGLAIVLLTPADAAPVAPASSAALVIAEAIPPTGMGDEKRPVTPEQRMRARYPQPVRVGDLIGLPVLDDSHRTLGHVREVVRTNTDRIELIVAYGGFLGWGVRPIAVPIEVIGIRGRELASLDMPRSEYATASTWQELDAAVLPQDASVLVALCRGY
jgi:hypothetical protein